MFTIKNKAIHFCDVLSGETIDVSVFVWVAQSSDNSAYFDAVRFIYVIPDKEGTPVIVDEQWPALKTPALYTASFHYGEHQAPKDEAKDRADWFGLEVIERFNQLPAELLQGKVGELGDQAMAYAKEALLKIIDTVSEDYRAQRIAQAKLV